MKAFQYKTFKTFVLGLLLLNCLWLNTANAQLDLFYVRPNLTDAAYDASEDSSYIAKNPASDKNILFLMLGGGYSLPKNYWAITYIAAEEGFDAISLKYNNDVGAATQASDPDSAVFYKLRQELCFGTPVFDGYDVDTLHSIRVRLIKLLQYLDANYPSQNWGQYLTTENEPNWEKIIVAGHSLGSGNAAYFGKKYKTKGVIILAGPNDYSTYYDQPAPWLSDTSLTCINRYFNYLSFLDEVVPFQYQYKNIEALGLLTDDDTTFSDFSTSPFNSSHCLYTKQVPGISLLYHNTPFKNSDTSKVVWRYFLNALIDSSLVECETLDTITNDSTNTLSNEIQKSVSYSIYPNPNHGEFILLVTAENSEEFLLLITDTQGRSFYEQRINSKNLIRKFNMEELNLTKGQYFVTIKSSSFSKTKLLTLF